MDLNEITEFLQSAARSVGAEVTSPWFYLQLGLILAATGIAYASGASVRAKVDVTSVAMGWPAPFRLFMRVLVSSAPTAVLAALMMLARGHAGVDPAGRSYLLAVAASSLAWLIIRRLPGDPQPSSSGWYRCRHGHRSAQHHRPARAIDADSVSIVLATS
jgi:hypothetical protein